MLVSTSTTHFPIFWDLSEAAVRHQRLPLQHRPQRLWPCPRLVRGRAAGGGHGQPCAADGHGGLQQRHQRLRAGEALGGGLAVLGAASRWDGIGYDGFYLELIGINNSCNLKCPECQGE